MELEFHKFEYHKKNLKIFQKIFFKEFEFHKLKFIELEFKKSGKSLHISNAIVNY